MAANVVDLWTRFAKTGNPNGGMNITWPAYTLEQGRYLDINSTPTVSGTSGPTTSAGSKTWKFVVFGDSPDPAENTATGVSPNLSPVASAVAKENPYLALYVGDLANGWMLSNASPMQDNYTGQIATDDYIAHNGIKETVNQSWVDGQLTQDIRPFMFVFGHSPVYHVEPDEADFLYSLEVHPKEAGAFWQSMAHNNVPAYFCGHTHMYVRGESQDVLQVISGNGGAGMPAFNATLVDPALTLEYPHTSIAQNDQQVGYLVITVHEDLGTYDGVQKMYNPATRSWETGDTFTMRAR